MKTKVLTFANTQFLAKAFICKESIEKVYSSSQLETEIVYYDAPKNGNWLAGLAETRIKTVKDQLRKYDQVAVLGADCVLYNKIDTFLSMPGRVVLVPHTTTPPSNAARFHRSGYANADVVCFRQGASAIIDWLLTQPMRLDPNNGMVFEQTLLTSLPYVADDIAICKDPTINYAYYNFYERELEHIADVFYVNGKPLALCQFSGYVDKEPEKISRYYHGPAPNNAVLELFRQYEKNISARILNEESILNEASRLDGWAGEGAARMMIVAAKKIAMSLRGPHMCVIVDRDCGQANLVLGSTLRAISPNSRLVAFGFREAAPSSPGWNPTSVVNDDLETADAMQTTQSGVRYSSPILKAPISLLLIGASDEKTGPANSFSRFENQIRPGGQVLIRTASDPRGMNKFIGELLDTKRYVIVKSDKTLIALEKVSK